MSLSTIFALSTPFGRSGLCIFRLSGPRALQISKSLCNINLSHFPREMKVVSINWQNRTIDSGLACFFKGPNSSTGEDVVEFNLHGSLAVIDGMRNVLKQFGHLDLREAERGEFTKRALINGKLSLTEVEGLADLLDAETQIQAQIYQSSLKGKVDDIVDKWCQQLLNVLVEIEALIEFEQTDELSKLASLDSLQSFSSEIQQAIKNSVYYDRIKNGFQVLFFGPANSGKSSLMNYLTKTNVSIVSEIEGTTRDLVQFDVDFDGVPLRLIDSAGIRRSNCSIEKIGVEIAKETAKRADVIVLLLPLGNQDFYNEYAHIINPEKTIFVASKSDLSTGNIEKFINMSSIHEILKLSCVTGEGVEELRKRILSVALNSQSVSSLTEKILLNQRQSECLKECHENVSNALGSTEIVCVVESIKSALKSLRKIRGIYFNVEEIYEKIFSNFCIGK